MKAELDVRLACLSARRNLTGAFVRVVIVGMALVLPLILSCILPRYRQHEETLHVEDSLTQTTFYALRVRLDPP